MRCCECCRKCDINIVNPEITDMKFHLLMASFAVNVVLATSVNGAAQASSESIHVRNAADDERANALAAKLIGELAAKCPVKPVGNMAALPYAARPCLPATRCCARV